MPALDDHATLILIDVQQGFDHPVWGTRNNPDAEQRMAELLAAWRASGWPIYHVQHLSKEPASPLRPGQAGVNFKVALAPREGEAVIQKHVNSAFIGTDLEQRLRAQGASTLVIAGLTTDHCVSTTTRMAGNLGFPVLLVGDATATFDRTGPDGRHHSAQSLHDLHLASLHDEFAQVTTAAAVLSALDATPQSGMD